MIVTAPTRGRRDRKLCATRLTRDEIWPASRPISPISRQLVAEREPSADGDMTTPTLDPSPSRRARSTCSPRHADDACRTGRGGSAIGMSACRRPGRWTLSFRLANGAVGNRRARPGWRSTLAGRRCASTRRGHRLPDRRRDGGDARRRAVPVLASRSASRRARRCARRRRGRRLAAPISPSRRLRRAGLSRQRGRPSRSAGSAAMAAARCAPAMCCVSATAPASRSEPQCRPRSFRRSRMTGRSACSTARTARPISSPTADIEAFFAAPRRCTTTRPAPACA